MSYGKITLLICICWKNLKDFILKAFLNTNKFDFNFLFNFYETNNLKGEQWRILGLYKSTKSITHELWQNNSIENLYLWWNLKYFILKAFLNPNGSVSIHGKILFTRLTVGGLENLIYAGFRYGTEGKDCFVIKSYFKFIKVYLNFNHIWYMVWLQWLLLKFRANWCNL